MKLAVYALAAAGVLGAVPFIAPEHAGSGTGSKPAQEAREAQLRYRLSVSGREGSCTVIKRDRTDAGRTELELGPRCLELMPRLAEARYWQENGAGDLHFVAADGSAVVEFFAADGVAYESLKPLSPLVALTAQ